MGDAVGVLERGAGAELDVEVDVAAGAGAAGAQLVVADDVAAGEVLDRGADRGELLGRERLVDEHAPGARDELEAGDDDRARDQQRDDGIEPLLAVQCTSASPTSTPSEV